MKQSCKYSIDNQLNEEHLVIDSLYDIRFKHISLSEIASHLEDWHTHSIPQQCT